VGDEIVIPDIKSQANERELVTFFLISYNQERYIREALDAAFAQTYQPLEIVLSDDCSTDRTFEIMSQMVAEYQGPHKVILNQNEHNLGLCGNVNRILDLASGEIVVIAAGDDISFPDRVEKSYQIMKDDPNINCLSFNLQTIDANGDVISTRSETPGCIEKKTLKDFISQKGFHFNGASRAYRRSAFNYFGPLSTDAVTEDSTLLLRCLLLGSVCFSSDVLLSYRKHGDNYHALVGKYSLNYKNINNQYFKDLDFAVTKQLVSAVDCVDLKNILMRKLAQNTLRSGYFLSEKKLRFFFSEILFSKCYQPLQKTNLFFNALRCSVQDVLPMNRR
jgi:glycosyltransferase involved in cell wall biosynthesis